MVAGSAELFVQHDFLYAIGGFLLILADQHAFAQRQAGVERVFQTHSAIIDSVEVKRRGKVRAGKLYYLRGLEGKAARIKEDLAAAAAAKAARLAEKA